jgi:hypothetical protein
MEATLDTRGIEPDEAQSIADALDSVDLDRLGDSEEWPPGAADTFRYELEVQRGDSTHTASFSERQVPAGLAPIVRTLMDRAHPSPRRR